MSLSHFGKHFDILGGGIDLRFPHHESEILQTECHTNHSPMSNFWLHSGHLTINKEKMSKSLDNFFLVRDIMKEYSAPVLRFYLLNGHYRSPIDFSDSNLKESLAAYRRLEGTYSRFKDSKVSGGIIPSDLEKAIEVCKTNFVSAMNDDFNTREGIAELFQLSRIANNFNPDDLDKDLKNNLLKTFEIYGTNVLGLFSSESLGDDLESKINQLIRDRNHARESKDWVKSDSIRDELTKMGIKIQDTPEGTKWNRI